MIQKWFSKIDFTLVFRLALSMAMGVTAYLQNDSTSGIFAIFLAVYALIAAKYKIGCGYNSCYNVPKPASKYAHKEESQQIDFTEIK